MKRTFLRTLGVVAMTGMLAAPALAQRGPGGPGGKGMRHRGPGPFALTPQLVELLQLTEAQQIAWGEALVTHRASAQTRHETMRALHEQLRASLESESPDTQAIGETMLAIHALRGERQSLRDALAAELRALLDSEQQVRFEGYLAAMETRRGWRGPGGGPGGPGMGPGPGFGPGGPGGSGW